VQGDFLRWKTYRAEEQVYEESLSPLYGWVNALMFDGAWRSLHVQVTGSYTLYGGRHAAIEGDLPLSPPPLPSSFSPRAAGQSGSGEGRVGFELDLWQRGDQSFALLPLLGFGGELFSLTRSRTSDTGATLSLRPLHQLWWGPFLGGTLFWQPAARWAVEAEFFYRWLHLRQWTKRTYQVDGEEATTGEWLFKTAKAHGANGALRARYRCSRSWLIGGELAYRSYFTGVRPLSTALKTTGEIWSAFPPEDLFKINLQSFFVKIEIMYDY
jgi:hypothetical protein